MINGMNELRERKNIIREKYKTLRREMEPSLKQKLDTMICDRFLALTSYRFADTLLMFAPLKDEIDIFPIVRDALRRGKTVAFPRCNGNDNTMTYYIVNDLTQLKEGSYGIREPEPSLPVYDPARSETEHTICFIPALVFDREGYRLGYGKGFYDRYLSAYKGTKMGVGYSRCVVDTLPRGRFDTAVDFVLTEKGVISINAIQN